MSDDRIPAEVTARQELPEGLVILRVAPTAGSLPTFQPGQAAALLIDDPEDPDGKPLQRFYSIVSAPGDEQFEFYIKLVNDGTFTGKLWQLDVGSPVGLGARAFGRFTLDPIPPGQDIVAVASGTGLAPFMSMLRANRGQQRWRRFVVVHTCRSAPELGYRKWLEQAAQDDPSIVYLPTVTREPADSNWQGLRGRPQLLLQPEAFEQHAGTPLDPAQCHVMLCGNPSMVDDIEQHLQPLGFRHHTQEQPGNLHFERYW